MFASLRNFVQRLDEIGQLKKVDGADWNLEIGTISELFGERKGPALLFDNIKGYPKGYRVVTNLLYTPERMKLGFGFPEGLSNIEAVKEWKDALKNYKPVPPVEVESGPIMENVITGDDIDILRFPAPKWHELDGGRYIGTGDAVITKDPDEGWVNVGVYRVMVHDSKTTASYVSPGAHLGIIRKKYWAKGESCPVVMCFGPDPLLFVLGGITFPWGMGELEVAGYRMGKPVEVIKGSITGLPIPAKAEIAVEGFIPPPSVDERPEGPFGEWTGYYASGLRPEPVVHIKAVYHRDAPILHGVPQTLIDPVPIPLHSASVLWNRLEATGIPGIKEVYVHGPGGRPIGVISIKQSYIGHAKQVATCAAALLWRPAITGRYIIVVDDDVAPEDWENVMWAVSTRCDPETSIDIVRGFLDTPLDPSISPEKRARGDFTTAKVIINACKPYHWINEFPPLCKASDELRQKTMDKWAHLFT